MGKEESLAEKKEKAIKNIKSNYCQLERSIVEQLYMKHDLHGTTVGSEREDIWAQLFEMVLPKKFVIEQSVFIIDAGEGVSHEVDLAIMDETYTPYIFRYGKLKFIPIEAVAAVVECKSKNLDVGSVKKWCDSIQELRTSKNSITRIATGIATEPVATQKSTRPIRILCALMEHVGSEVAKCFDFVLCAVREDESKKNDSRIKITATEEFDTLFDWYRDLNFYDSKEADALTEKQKESENKLKEISLNEYEVSDSNGKIISLLTFNFQMNQLLMLINNPMLFPHKAYVDMFNRDRERGLK